ncbi:MAG: alpha/beta fold hydrolase [Gammaproteobacteria bacterium]|nr:alpha/beta fold hydrolase [Gammaproteobacteria bacterium]
MPRSMSGVLLTIIGVYVVACGALFAAQKKLLYFPTGNPALPAQQLLTINVDGATINVSTRSASSSNAVVYFGGNAEDVSMSLPDIAQAFPGHAIYMVHYRGYGGSSGKPSEKALHADAQAVYDHVSDRHADIVVIGRSLGSGVAVRLAAVNPLERLVLVTPFDSIVNVAKDGFPIFPVRLLLTERFESWRYASAISVATTIVAAEKDEVISLARTRALYAAFNPDIIRFETIKGVGHNDISATPAYVHALGKTQQHSAPSSTTGAAEQAH